MGNTTARNHFAKWFCRGHFCQQGSALRGYLLWSAWQNEELRPVIQQLSEVRAELIHPHPFVNEGIRAGGVEFIDSFLHGVSRKDEHGQ